MSVDIRLENVMHQLMQESELWIITYNKQVESRFYIKFQNVLRLTQ